MKYLEATEANKNNKESTCKTVYSIIECAYQFLLSESQNIAAERNQFPYVRYNVGEHL
jgi:hypothetical protein